MSRDDDETRLYQCSRKYEKIVKQFDELMKMMDSGARPVKQRRVSVKSKGSNGSNSTVTECSSEADNNEAIMQTVTKYLRDMRSNPETESDSSTSTRDSDYILNQNTVQSFM